MLLTAKIACLVALLIAIAWLIYKPGFDSGIAVAAALAALISTFFLKKNDDSPTQKQEVSSEGVGIQAGRDVKVDKFKGK